MTTNLVVCTIEGFPFVTNRKIIVHRKVEHRIHFGALITVSKNIQHLIEPTFAIDTTQSMITLLVLHNVSKKQH